MIDCYLLLWFRLFIYICFIMTGFLLSLSHHIGGRVNIQAMLSKCPTSIQGSISDQIKVKVILKVHTGGVEHGTLSTCGLSTSLKQSENFSVID